MMDGFAFGLASGLVMGMLFTAFITYGDLRIDAMREAFERGHAVQCFGKTGYHWECEK